MTEHNEILNSQDWKDFKRALEPLEPQDKGTPFEELTRLYLLTEPTFSTKIKKIWHHKKIPQKVMDELGLVRPEIGVDLLAQVKDGTYWAIQCKYHSDQTRNVSLKEISTFFSVTERKKTYSKLSHRLVCTSANEISRNVQKLHSEKLGYLTSADFSKLGKDEFNAFRDLLNDGDRKLVPFHPRPHQSVALDKCVSHFKNRKNKRGKIIHPCGSGKSLTGYWISQKLQSKTTLLAVPSLALVRQTLSTWTREAIANGIEMDWIAVCSDEDVKKSDDPLMQKVDLGIEVNTDPQVVADFLSKKRTGNKVVVTTYQSGVVVSEGLKKSGKTFDLGIFDEAHKTVGQKDKKFAHLLYDENIQVDKRVFMTATEREFKGNSDEYLSMSDPDIYGTIIDELSFKKALEQKKPILSDYKIVTTAITKSEIEQLINENNFVKSDGSNWTVEGDASTFAALIALRKLINERRLKHVVSFHSSIKRSRDFQTLNTEVRKADNSFEELSTFHVSGKNSTGVRAAELERFIESSPALITNARCLTEGVDVPAIDAVLFADPKQSKIDIVQAAGRALRKFKGKKFGYIIVPVVIDEYEENPTNDAFNQIITVISALGMSDNRIIDQYSLIADGKKVKNPIVEIDFPEIIRVEFEDLIANIEILIWDRLSFGWEKGFKRLKEFAEINKNCQVPYFFKNEDGFNLGGWVSERRRSYQLGNLSSEHEQKLESVLGWVWSIRENQFQKGFEQLKKYEKEYHHLDVPSAFEDLDGFQLGRWISYQRKQYLLGKLSNDKVEKLESVKNWLWVVNVNEESFLEGFNALKEYSKEHNHIEVSRTYVNKYGFKLGTWIASQRGKYTKKKLSLDRIERLESVEGWVWNAFEKKFEIGFKQLQNFIETHNHSRVSEKQKIGESLNLGKWVGTQRYKYAKNRLSLDKIKKLESLEGWVWNISDEIFQEGFQKLKKYIKDNGNCQVPGRFVDEDGYKLGQILQYWRNRYNKGILSEDIIKKLESLDGWVWGILDDDFEKGFKSLKKYEKKYHHSRVVNRYKDENNFHLGRWVAHQRLFYKKNKLSLYRIKRLESVKGWVWYVSEYNFQEGFKKLEKYVENNLHSRIPISFKDKDGFNLGSWVSSKRRLYRLGKLSSKQVQKLESIKSWIWDVTEEDFESGLNQLIKYEKEHGNSTVPSRFVDNDGFRLGGWVGHRRREYKMDKLSSDRIQKLESLKGWKWQVKKGSV